MRSVCSTRPPPPPPCVVHSVVPSWIFFFFTSSPSPRPPLFCWPLYGVCGLRYACLISRWRAQCGGLKYEFGVAPVNPEAVTCDDSNAVFTAPEVVPEAFRYYTYRTGRFSWRTVKIFLPRTLDISNDQLSMVQGQHYVAIVRFTNYIGQTRLECSPAFKVDTTPPQILGTVDHLDPRRLPVRVPATAHAGSFLAAQWEEMFVDGESNAGVPMDYGYFVHTTPGVPTRGYPRFTTGMEFMTTSGSVVARDGESYYVTVYARNRAGSITSYTTPTPVYIDHSPPVAGDVRDGGAAIGDDLSFVELSPELRLGVNWDPFTDNHGTVSYEVAFGFRPNQDTVATFRAVSPAEAAARRYSLAEGAAGLTHGALVFATVRATNEAGLYTVGVSSGVFVDATPPLARASHFMSTTVPAGAGTGDALTIGAQAGSNGARQFQDHGLGFAVAVHCTEDLRWNGVTYTVSFGTSAGVSDVAGPFTTAARVVSTGVLPPASRVAHGGVVYAWGTCTNEAGMVSTLAPVALQTDTTPPATASAVVRHVDTAQAGSPEVAFTARTTLEAMFNGWTDGDSGMAPTCEFAVAAAGVAPSAGAWRPETAVGFARVTAADLPTSHGRTYMFWVRCANLAGAASTVTSAGVTIHRVAPAAASVRDGPSTAVTYSLSRAVGADASVAGTVKHDAAALSDTDDATGFASHAAAAGDHFVELTMQAGGGGAAAASWVDAVAVTPLASASAAAASSVRVYVLDADLAWDLVGHVTVPGTVGTAATLRFPRRFVGAVRLDVPAGGGTLEVGSVRVMEGDVEGLASPVTSLAASWSDVDDPTGVASVQWSVATCPGASTTPHVVFPFTSSGVALATSSATLPIASSLLPGVRYCTSVRITSNVGLAAVFASDGFQVYDTAPVFTFASDGATALDADIQKPLDTLSATWGFTDGALPLSASLGYVWQAGTSPGAADVFASRSAESLTTATATGLAVATGTTVYMTVTATNPAGLTATGYTDGILLDETLPDGLDLSSGGLVHVDVQVNLALTVLTATWPVTGGASQFLFTVGTCNHCDDVQALLSVGTATAGAVTAAFTVGTQYYVDVFAHTARGLSAYGHGSVVADNTPPDISDLLSTVDPLTNTSEAGFTVSYNPVSSLLSLSWPAGTVPVTYAWSIGMQPGVAGVAGPVDVGTATSATATVVLHPSPHAYHVNLVVTSTVSGLSSTVTVQLFVDNQGPARGWVMDGVDKDLQFQSSTSELQCAFGGFVDPISAVAAYYAGFGSDVGLTDVTAWTSVALLPSADEEPYVFSASSLSLTPGQQYHCVVKAVDSRGFATVKSSSGVTVETTAPVAGTVFDGPVYGIDRAFQDTLTGVSASWTGFVEPESAIGSFDWGVGTSPGADDLVPFHSVGLNTAASDPTAALTEGVTYYSTVRCWNIRGLVSTATSDGFVVDHTAPTTASLLANATYLIAEGVPDRTTCACRDAFASFIPGSGTCACDLGRSPVVATTAAGSEVQCACTSEVCSSTPMPVPLLPPPPPCTPSADRSGPHASDSTVCACAPGYYLAHATLTCTLCPPNTFKAGVGDAPAACVPCWYGGSTTATLEVEWSATGATSFDVMAGTAPGVAPYVTPLVPPTTGHQFVGLPIQQASQWFVTLHAAAAGGGVSSTQVTTPTVDFLPPACDEDGVVDLASAEAAASATPTDEAYQTHTTALRVAWTSCTAVSDVTRVEVAFGTGAYGTDVSGGWMEVDPNTSVYEWSQGLTQGVTYFASVRTTSGRGVASVRSSDGIRVDSTTPVVTGVAVMDTAACGNFDADFTPRTDGLEAAWDMVFSDAESGIVSYEYSLVATSPGATSSVELVPWTTTTFKRVRLTADAVTGAASLEQGATYVLWVRATNGAGLTSTAVASDGVVVDMTPPRVTSLPAVVNATGSPLAYWTASTSSLRVHAAFEDLDSGVASVTFFVGLSDSGREAGRCTVVSQEEEEEGYGAAAPPHSVYVIHDCAGVALVSGLEYDVSAVATSGAGVTSPIAVVAASAVMVDTSAPTAGGVGVVATSPGAAPGYHADTTALDVASTSAWMDLQSGVATVEVALGTVPTPASDAMDNLVTGWEPVAVGHGGDYSHSFANVAGLTDGDAVAVVTRATNNAGLVATAQSQAVVVDASPPSLTGTLGVRVATHRLRIVFDNDPVMSTDPIFLASADDVHVSWQIVFRDADSSLARFEWTVVAVADDGTPAVENALAGPFSASGAETFGAVALGLTQGDRCVACGGLFGCGVARRVCVVSRRFCAMCGVVARLQFSCTSPPPATV